MIQRSKLFSIVSYYNFKQKETIYDIFYIFENIKSSFQFTRVDYNNKRPYAFTGIQNILCNIQISLYLNYLISSILFYFFVNYSIKHFNENLNADVTICVNLFRFFTLFINF